jgi:hypothetical protein
MELLEAFLWVALGFVTTYVGLEVAWKETILKKKMAEAAVH